VISNGQAARCTPESFSGLVNGYSGESHEFRY